MYVYFAHTRFLKKKIPYPMITLKPPLLCTKYVH